MPLLLLILVQGCSILREPVVINSSSETVYKDSVVVRDSIVYVPEVKIVSVVPKLDTLRLETSVASSIAYLDTTENKLNGELITKPQRTEYRTIEKIKEVRDSVYVEVPVEVEKIKTETKIPSIFWVSLAVNLIFVLLLILKLKKLQ